MPVKSANVKQKTGFARARKKIKDIGIGVATAVATMAPLKGAAQDMVIDPESTHISLLVETIRQGMTVENHSSPDKEFLIFSGVDNRFIFDDSLRNMDINTDEIVDVANMRAGRSFYGVISREAEVSGLYNSDAHGLYFNLVKSALFSEDIFDRRNYIYNTDRLYDKYIEILGKQFKPIRKMPHKNVKIVVHCLEEFTKISAYDRENRGKLLGSMVMNGLDGEVLGHSHNHEVFVFKTNDDMKNYRVYDGTDETIIPVKKIAKASKPRLIRDYRLR